MTEWSSRSIGSRLQHTIFYRLIALCGRRGGYALLFWVIAWYMCCPAVQRRSAAYITRRFPYAGLFGRLIHRWRLHWEFGKVLVDRAAAGILGQGAVTCTPEENALLARLHGEGKGLILLASHVGCWHTAMTALHDLLPVPANAVMYRDELDYDRHDFEHRNQAPPFAVIDPSDGARSAVAMIQALQRGEILSLMGDRPFGHAPVCRVPLLEGSVPLPYSAYYLASVSGAPIVVFFAYRTGPGTARHHIAAVIRVPAKLGKKAEAYAPYVRMYAAALEQSAKEAPYQFFNFFNMWGEEAA